MEPGTFFFFLFLYLGDLIHIMELPISMLQPVSLLENLSDFLRFIHLLYEKEYA